MIFSAITFIIFTLFHFSAADIRLFSSSIIRHPLFLSADAAMFIRLLFAAPRFFTFSFDAFAAFSSDDYLSRYHCLITLLAAVIVRRLDFFFFFFDAAAIFASSFYARHAAAERLYMMALLDDAAKMQDARQRQRLPAYAILFHALIC